MKYLDESFSVAVGSDAYRDGWERIFGRREPVTPSEHRPALLRVRSMSGLCDVDAGVQAAMDAGLVQRIGCGFAAALILTEAGQAVLEPRE